MLVYAYFKFFIPILMTIPTLKRIYILFCMHTCVFFTFSQNYTRITCITHTYTYISSFSSLANQKLKKTSKIFRFFVCMLFYFFKLI